MKFKILLLIILATFSKAFSQEEVLPPNIEFRGIWVSTVFSLDWPKANDELTQKTELMALFDAVKDANMNAVLLQVRAESDAFYNSSKEPWSRWLTGVQGQDPGYDPLAFAVEEAHKRGLELHAWVNPFRVNASTSSSTIYSDDHISNTNPELLIEYASGQKIINPGLPEAREYVVSIVEEITQNYDIDGIHFDDYFYPYSGTTEEDLTTYETYGAGFANIGDWRRHNVNETVRQVYEAIKAINPGVRFGISPFGIWKNGVPEGIIGMDAYNVIYADAVHWIENQTVDYVTPQLYWPIGGGQDFKKLLEWWAEKTGNATRHLYAGHTLNEITSSGERVGSNGMKSIAMMESQYSFLKVQKTAKTQKLLTQSVEEVPNQIAIVRENRDNNAMGSIFFRASFLTANPLGFTDYLKEHTYQYPAAPPVMEWIEGEAPLAPENLTATVSEASGDYLLSWQRNTTSDHDFKRFLVYRLPTQEGNIEGFGEVRGLTSDEEFAIPYESLPYGTSYWAVAELGELNYKSEISNVIVIENNVIPLIQNPVVQDMVTENNFVRFEWEDRDEFTAYHYQWASDDGFINIIEENDTLDSSYSARLFNNLTFGETYYFRMRAKKINWSDWTPTYKVTVGQSITGIQSSTIQNLKIYPNPSSSFLYVDLDIKKATQVNVNLVSIDGNKKLKLAEDKFDIGKHQINIDKNSMGAGVYVLIIQVDDHKEVQKIIFN